MPHTALKQECLAANLALPKTGLVDLTFGQVTVADPERRVFAIEPSGVDYDRLTSDDLVILDYDGNILEGTCRPSSDTPTHRGLFLNFPGIRSVVHTYSRSAVAFTQAGLDLPCLGTSHCDSFGGPVPVTRVMTQEEVAGDYEGEAGKVIVECFAGRNPLDLPAILVRNHGPFAWGPSAAKAVETALALAIIADRAIKTLALNPSATPAPAHLPARHFYRKNGPDAYYGQA